MLAFGIAFVLWARLRPVRVEADEIEADRTGHDAG
jgi:hypothetical protein